MTSSGNPRIEATLLEERARSPTSNDEDATPFLFATARAYGLTPCEDQGLRAGRNGGGGWVRAKQCAPRANRLFNRASLHDGDVVYFIQMDVLRRDEIELARRTPEAQRGRQALDAMRMGFRLKRAALRTRYPEETEDSISARFRRWLAGDERP